MRYFNDSVGDSILLDSNFFNSLKHDSNPYYPEHKTHFFNGTYYMSYRTEKNERAQSDIIYFATTAGME